MPKENFFLLNKLLTILKYVFLSNDLARAIIIINFLIVVYGFKAIFSLYI